MAFESNRPPPPPPPPRAFQPVSVGICHLQTATDRFGDEAKRAIRERERASMSGLGLPYNWLSLEPDNETSPDNSIYRLIPSMQSYRNNLTALSQAHNLYFVAYQGHIFVYVPRGVPKQTIPRVPDLDLVPEPSKASYSMGGCVDSVSPHTINHIITGFLGEDEIVVACFDDGDVIAYYVKAIADWVFSKPNVSTAAQSSPKRAQFDNPPRLFFHENVGHSAWGLAVHRKSRLIAVSSNRCEVTVFALALATCLKEPPEARESCECHQICNDDEVDVSKRASNFRIVVALGKEASNIPNICFVDLDDGTAEMICAVDIKGNMWLADIWRIHQPVNVIGPSTHAMLLSEEFSPASSKGWGVLALAENCFMEVHTVAEMLGMPERDLDILKPGVGFTQPMVDVNPCIEAIPEHPNLPPRLPMPRPVPLGQYQGTVNQPSPLLAGTLDADAPEDEPGDESEAEYEESEESEEQGEEANEGMDQGSDGEEETENIAVMTNTQEITAIQSTLQSAPFEPFSGQPGTLFQPHFPDVLESIPQYTPADLAQDQVHVQAMMQAQANALAQAQAQDQALALAQATQTQVTQTQAPQTQFQPGFPNFPGSFFQLTSTVQTQDQDQTLAQASQAQFQSSFEGLQAALTQISHATFHVEQAHAAQVHAAQAHAAQAPTEQAPAEQTHAAQGFDVAMQEPDYPMIGTFIPSDSIPFLIQTSGDLDSVTSKDDERSTVDSMLSGLSDNEPASQSPLPPLDMAFFPHNGTVQRISRRTPFLVEFLRRPVQFNPNVSRRTDRRIERVAKQYRFLRAYEKDLELRSLLRKNERVSKEVGVLCPDAVTLGMFQDRTIRPYFRATSRLSMLAHIPELSLVVVGSQIGRVLLLTPTKLRSPVKNQAGVWDHGLRVEWILPRESDESAYRKTLRPLHGMAIGPVQDDVHMGGHKVNRAAVPRRYRLMLHYRTHDILTYEITREEQTGKLCIF